MPRYNVTLVETVRYWVEVEAENEDEAGDLACDVWAESDDPTKRFDGEGQGVDVLRVTPLAWEPA
jgi:hypothetical protein